MSATSLLQLITATILSVSLLFYSASTDTPFGDLRYSSPATPNQSSQDAGWLEQSDCGAHFWIVLNIVARNHPPGIRLVFLYVEPDKFTVDNLRSIFLCLSHKYPQPENLEVIARSDRVSLRKWIQDRLAFQSMRPDGSYDVSLLRPTDLSEDLENEVGFFRSTYTRNDDVEQFIFSRKPSSREYSLFIIERNPPFRSSGDSMVDLVRACSHGLED